MKSWEYDEGDVLRIKWDGKDTIARVAGYEDSLNDETALYVNLRGSDGKRWRKSYVTIYKADILAALPVVDAQQKRETTK